MSEAPTGLFRKLAAIAAEVTVVNKQGHNDHFHYDYVREIDVVAEIRQLLVKHGVLALPSVLGTGVIYEMTNGMQGKKLLTTCDIEILFVDVETGETLMRTWSGEGQDPGDKGIYKAITGALKYGYLKTFQVPTEDDPENDAADKMQRMGERAQGQARTAAAKASTLAPKGDKPGLSAPSKPTPPTAPAPVKCADCGVELADKAAAYSKGHFGRPLCYKCQDVQRKKAAE